VTGSGAGIGASGKRTRRPSGEAKVSLARVDRGLLQALEDPGGNRVRKQAMQQRVDSEEETWQRTIDLAEIAKINRGDRVRVQRLEDKTQGLFSETISLLQVGEEAGRPSRDHLASSDEERYIPENEHLRKVYLFAEAVGGYEALNDLSSKHSPGQTLSREFGRRAQTRALSDEEVAIVQQYHRQLTDALKNANRYLLANKLQDFTHAELYELYEILKAARARSEELSAVLGTHLIHEIENAIQRLHEIREKARTVDKSVSGIFLVNSEVMFIPTDELIKCVSTIFAAVGNPYVANNVDGVLLLAGRNLLIDVISFYSYYGKHQIYRLFAQGSTAVKPQVIVMHIRREIRKLFKAVTADNKLVLTRVMKDVEREFELSVEAIQVEAEQQAFEQVKVFLPREEPKKEIEKKSWLRRVVGWIGGE
jgi:hypothetical protein